jgi:hypothetical protein
MNTRRLVGVVMVAAGMIGCSGSVDTGTSSAGLTLEEEAGLARGTYVGADGAVSFTSQFVDTNVLEILVDLDGMTISSLVDFDTGVIEYDGYTTATGETTQLLETDRALLIELTHELEGLGTAVSEPVERLRGFVSMWSEFPSTLDLQLLSLMDEDRGYASYCGYYNQYVRITHDCDTGSHWNDRTTVDGVRLTMNGHCGSADGTWFWTGAQWACYEPGHDSNIEWADGNCFGRCGDGCGSSRQFTLDCLEHDLCVRFGHSTASFWCNDEFSAASDDWTYAPNCW